MMKRILLIFVISFICPLISLGQFQVSNVYPDLTITGNADADFKALNKLLYRQNQRDREIALSNIEVRIDKYSDHESLMHRYRQFGLELWYRYPMDPRRYDWFKTTLSASWLNLHYWKDTRKGSSAYLLRANKSVSYEAEINWNSLTAWEKIYQDVKLDYFRYLDTMEIDSFNSKEEHLEKINFLKTAINAYELECFIKLSLNSSYRHYQRMDLKKMEVLTIQAMNSFKDLKSGYKDLESVRKIQYVMRALDNDFLAKYRTFGLNERDLLSFFNSLSKKATNNPILMEWIIQRSSLIKLRNEPFNLKYRALDGREIDLDKMKGKVILVDFWSTWCSACVERMPAIKTVYDKYKDRGFEVISICLNDKDKLDEVKKIEIKIGADWPLLMIGSVSTKNTLGQIIWTKYGFWGVPQLLLLNKRGELVLLNDILRNGDFEPIVEQLLAEKDI